jgi:hypothetical protein
VLQRREIEEKQRVATLLAPWRRTLEQLLESGQTTTEKILALVQVLIEPHAERQHLKASVRLAKFLLEQTQGFDLTAWILEVNEDVLGAYHFILVSQPTFLSEPERQESHVELYWGSLGFSLKSLVSIPRRSPSWCWHRSWRTPTPIGTRHRRQVLG